MTASRPSQSNLRRAVMFMTVSSLLVPVAGVLTQPILARALGLGDRGALAAAVAPAALTISVATLGLPEAMTYYTAKYPSLTRRGLSIATVMTIGVGIVCLAVILPLLSFLSAGDPELSELIFLGMVAAVPTLAVGVLRGAASGHQMWGSVAAERIIISFLRVTLFLILWLADGLTVLIAVVISTAAPLVGGLVYLPLLRGSRSRGVRFEQPVAKSLLSFGSRVWLGAVTEMFLARVGQILMAPLSDLDQLALYSVAVAISDVPIIIALALQSALFATNSKDRDAQQLATTTRIVLLAGIVGCSVLCLSLPFWLASVFGPDFQGAVVPTWLLLASAVVCIPGLMAAVGLSAWGRPGLRSLILVATLATNVAVFVTVVPELGAVGGGCASLVSNGVMSALMLTAASKTLPVVWTDFVLIRRADIQVARREIARVSPLRR